MSELVEIECECSTATENAIMIENINGKNIWIPKSQISDYSTDTGLDLNDINCRPISIFIQEWLAIEKDLV